MKYQGCVNTVYISCTGTIQKCSGIKCTNTGTYTEIYSLGRNKVWTDYLLAFLLCPVKTRNNLVFYWLIKSHFLHKVCLCFYYYYLFYKLHKLWCFFQETHHLNGRKCILYDIKCLMNEMCFLCFYARLDIVKHL